MVDVKMMVGKWCADWAKKKREEEGTEGALSSWMTVTARPEPRDDPMILCEEGDNSVLGKTNVAIRVSEAEVIMAGAMVPIGQSEGALANGIEEGEVQ